MVIHRNRQVFAYWDRYTRGDEYSTIVIDSVSRGATKGRPHFEIPIGHTCIFNEPGYLGKPAPPMISATQHARVYGDLKEYTGA